MALKDVEYEGLKLIPNKITFCYGGKFVGKTRFINLKTRFIDFEKNFLGCDTGDCDKTLVNSGCEMEQHVHCFLTSKKKSSLLYKKHTQCM